MSIALKPRAAASFALFVLWEAVRSAIRGRMVELTFTDD